MAEGKAYSLHTIWWLGLADITIATTKLEKDKKILDTTITIKLIFDQKGFHMDHELEQFGNVTIRQQQQTALDLHLGQFAQLAIANPHQSSNIWTFLFLVVECLLHW